MHQIFFANHLPHKTIRNSILSSLQCPTFVETIAFTEKFYKNLELEKKAKIKMAEYSVASSRRQDVKKVCRMVEEF